MKVPVDIIPFSENDCICLEYVPGADIKLITEHNSLYICSNAEGLQFLAKICLTLAQSDIPEGHHIHLDGFDFIQGNGLDLTIERT